MPNLTRKQKFYLLFALVIILILILAGASMIPAKTAMEEESAKQDIPEAEKDNGFTSKIDSYRSRTSREFDQLEENGSETPPQNSPSAFPKADAGVESVFGEFRDESKTGPSSTVKKSGSSSTQKAQKKEPQDKKAEPEAEVKTQDPAANPTSQVKRSGAVSSLDDDRMASLGSGISSLDQSDLWVSDEEGKPYRCMFTRDEKIKSGQRVTIRLLEDLVIRGVHIPANTHLQAVCTISERMELKVGSLDMGGRIIQLGLDAFDTDGGKGIYCSDLSRTKDEVTQQAVATGSSLLNSRLGRVARDAATLGASIIRSKSGEVTVSVPAGYSFYIIKEQR